MGNNNLNAVKVENYPDLKNDIKFCNTTPDKDKEFVNKEKKNMKLINKHNKECKDADLIQQCLVNHFFLRALEKQARQEIVKEMSLYFIQENSEIFFQGDPPGCYYIIRQGTIDIIMNGEKKVTLQKGNYFGDSAILYGINREYTAKASMDCYIWVMEKKNFKKVIEHILHITYEDNNSNIGKLDIFSIATHDQKIKMANNLYRETHLENQPIYKKGDVTDCIYILKDGGIDLKKDGKLIKSYSKGECFGVLEVLGNSNRITEAIPNQKTHVLNIPLYWLQNLYGENYSSIIGLFLIKAAFGSNPNLKKFNLKFLDEIFNLITFKYYEKEEEIIKAGEPKMH